MSGQLTDTKSYDDDSRRKKSQYIGKIEVPLTNTQLQYHCPALAAVESLIERSFFVMDDFISTEEVDRLRAEVAEYYSTGHMEEGQIGNDIAGGGGKTRKDMRDDVIAWFEGSESWVKTAMRRHILRMDVFSQKVSILLEAIKPELTWEGAGRTKIMASLYRGGKYGARYVPHYDNPNGNGRRFTTIVYLNPSWKASDGGMLRVKTDTEVADVAPLGGRLVCFWSDKRVPHEVMPALAKDRYAVTIWYMDAKERRMAEKRLQIEKAVAEAQKRAEQEGQQ